MKNLWQTTPGEDVLIVLFLLCCLVAFALFLFAIALTVSAVLGHFSRSAIVLYWSYALCSGLLHVCDYPVEAMLLFVLTSPFIAFGMHLFARRNKSKVTMISIWSEPVDETSEQKGETE